MAEGTAQEPAGKSLKAIREAAAACKRCDLWRPATQIVLGKGPARARILVVGEQPGDREDLAGEPFVGPAGLYFQSAFDEPGIERGSLFPTNALPIRPDGR